LFPAFKTFGDASLLRAVSEAASFVNDCRREKEERDTHRPEDCVLDVSRWLTLTGDVGCGKTTLVEEVFKHASKFNPGNASLWVHSGPEYSEKGRRPRCVWLHVSEFAERLRAGEYDLPERLAVDYLVAIDDIGANRDTTAFVSDGLYRLANVRLGKWTLFTTNLSLQDIATQIDRRFASRMLRDRNVTVKITAPDYAARKATR
jgi:DNA replication protein DnaC